MSTELLGAVKAAAELHSILNTKASMLNDGRTRIDPFKIAAHLGVSVMLRPLEKLLGAFVNESRPGILINSARPAGLMAMTCAHELGHFNLGHAPCFDTDINVTRSSKFVERQADTFATSLLTPPWLIPHVMRIKGWSRGNLDNPSIVYQLSLRLGISYQATTLTLQRTRLLNDRQLATLLAVKPATIKRQYFSGYEFTQDIGNSDVWFIDKCDTELIIEPKPKDFIIASVENLSSSGYRWRVGEQMEDQFAVEQLRVPYLSKDTYPLTEHSIIGGVISDLVLIHLTQAPEFGKTQDIKINPVRPFDSSSIEELGKKFCSSFYTLDEGLEASTKSKFLEENLL